MKKILTFIVAFFTLALFVVSLSQPMKAGAAGEKVTLEFTEQNGNFLSFEKGKYSTTAKVNVAVKNSTGENEIVIKYNPDELELKAVDGIPTVGGQDQWKEVKAGELKVFSNDINFDLTFEVAKASQNVYGVPFAGYVDSINGEKVENNYFYFVRGLYGDVNCDGKINLVDYSAIKQVILGKDVVVNGAKADVKALGDINHDGYVNFTDYRLVFDTYTAAQKNNDDVKADKFSDAGYCTVVVKEEGKGDTQQAVKFGEEFNGQVVTNNNQEVVVEKEEAPEYAVNYFFSTSAGATPVVVYVEAGEIVDFIVPNGDMLINGYIQWYQLVEENGVAKMVKVLNDAFVMPEKEVYLYAYYYKDPIKPNLIYKVADNVLNQWTKEFDFLTVVTKDEINSVNTLDENANSIADIEEYTEGYKFNGWFFDKELTQEVKDFLMLEDTIVYASLTPREYKLIFKSEDKVVSSTEVPYKEKIEALKMNNAGMIFKGWVEQGKSEVYEFTTMPARDLVLNAQWYDVVKETVDFVNDKNAKVGTDKIAELYYDAAEYKVKEVIAKLYLEELLDKNGDVKAEAFDNILTDVSKFIADTYTNDVLEKLAINGFVVYQDGQIKNKGVEKAAISVVSGLLQDIANGTVDNVVFTLNDTREVKLVADLIGTDSQKAKIKDYAAKLDQHVDAYYDEVKNETVVEVVLPYKLVSKLEEEAGKTGADLIDAVNETNVKDLINKLDDATQKLDQAKLDLANAIVNKISKYSELAEQVDYEEDVQIYVEGVKIVLSTKATTLSELFAELVADDSQIASLLGKDMSEFYNPLGFHQFEIEIKFNLEEVAQIQNPSFTQKIDLRIYLYQKEYSITFVPNGGDLVIPTNQPDLVVDGAKVTGKVTTLVDVTVSKEGYKFEGWYEDPLFNVIAEEPIAIPYGNKTYYAKWTPIKYTITYDLNDKDYDGTAPAKYTGENPEVFTVESGVITLVEPTRKNFTFKGWKDEKGNIVTTVDATSKALAKENVTLTAQWESHTFRVYFAAVGGGELYIFNLLKSDTITIEKENIEYYDAIEPLKQIEWHGYSLERTGYEIIGYKWKYYGADDSTYVALALNEKLNVQGDVYIQPIYEAKKFTLTFNMNEYACPEALVGATPAPMTVTFDQKVGLLPVPEARGYEFVGWFTEPDGGVEITAEYKYNKNGDLEVYAHWVVIDVIQNAVDEALKLLDEIIEQGSYDLPYEVVTTKAANSKGIELVDTVTVKLIAANVLDTKNYTVNNDALLNLFGKIAEIVATDKQLVDEVVIDGEVIFDGAIYNDVFRNLLLDLVVKSVSDVAAGVEPSFVAEIAEQVGERDVEFKVEVEGSDELKEKIKKAATKLQQKVEVTYDDDSIDVEIIIPQVLVKEIEAEVVKAGKTLQDAFDAVTLEELIDLVADKVDALGGKKGEYSDKAAELICSLENLINQIIDENLVSAKVNDASQMVILKDNMEFKPASKDIEGLVNALKAMLNQGFLDLTVGYFETGYLEYTISVAAELDVKALGLFYEDKIKEVVNIKIICNPNEYDVTLDAADGEFAGGEKVVTIKDKVGELLEDNANYPGNPTKPLYKFIGWYDENGNLVVNFKNADIKVTAKYEPIQYTVNYDPNPAGAYDGTLTADPAKVTIEAGKDLTEVVLASKANSKEEYYVFEGWTFNGAIVSDAEGNVDETKLAEEIAKVFTETVTEITLEAKWAKNKFHAYLRHAGNAGARLFTTPVEYNDVQDIEALMSIITLDKEGYNIIGYEWTFLTSADYKDEGGVVELYFDDKDKTYTPVPSTGLAVTGTIFVKPIYEGKPIELFLDKNTTDGDVLPYQEKVTIKYGDELDQDALPKPERAGYVFAGWYMDKDANVELPQYALDNEMTTEKEFINGQVLYAKWVEIPVDANKALVPMIKDFTASAVDYDFQKLAADEYVLFLEVKVEDILNGAASLNEGVASAVADKVVKYIKENYVSINNVELNGVQVMKEQVILNEGIKQFVEEYVDTFLQLTDGSDPLVAPKVVIDIEYCDYNNDSVVNTSVVYLQPEFKATSAAVKAKYYDVVELLGSMIDVKDAEYTITLNEDMVKYLEEKAFNAGKSLEGFLNEMTVSELLDNMASMDENAMFEPTTLAALENLAKFGYKFNELTNLILGNDVINPAFVKDGAEYKPADNTIDSAILGLKDILDPAFDVELSNYLVAGKYSQYTIGFDVVYDGSSIATSNAPVTATTKLNIVIPQNLVEVELYVDGAVAHVAKGYVGEVYDEYTPVKAGYSFVGWLVKGSGEVYSNTKDFVMPYAGYGLVLEAKFVENDYVVTLDPNGGTVSDTEINVDYDAPYGKFETLPTPVKAGYDFAGWYDENGNKVEDTTIVKIAKNHTLTAKWDEHEYTLTVYAYNGTALVDHKGQDKVKEITYTVSTTLTNIKSQLPDLETEYTIAGYTAKWNADATVYDTLIAAIKADTTNKVGDQALYAVYTPIVYKAEYFIEGSLYDTLTFTVEDTKIAGEKDITDYKTGYTGKWDYTFVPGTTTNLTINAKFEIHSYTFKFVANYDKYNGFLDAAYKEKSVTVQYGSYLKLNDVYTNIYCSGYEFLGWQYEVAGTKYSLSSITLMNLEHIEKLGNGAVIEVKAVYETDIYKISFIIGDETLSIKHVSITASGLTLKITDRYAFPAKADAFELFTYNQYGARYSLSGGPVAIATATNEQLTVVFGSTVDHDNDPNTEEFLVGNVEVIFYKGGAVYEGELA